MRLSALIKKLEKIKVEKQDPQIRVVTTGRVVTIQFKDRIEIGVKINMVRERIIKDFMTGHFSLQELAKKHERSISTVQRYVDQHLTPERFVIDDANKL